MIVEVIGRLLVEAGLHDQSPGRVVLEAGLAVVLVAQAQQLAELVPVVGEGAVVGVVALVNQAGFVVVPTGAAVQGIGVAEQAAFGIVFEAVLGLVGVYQASQLTGLVVILGGFPRCVDRLAQLPEPVVLPQRGLA
ncbi:hypothetical protein D3C80_1797530 [compost metagenome]